MVLSAANPVVGTVVADNGSESRDDFAHHITIPLPHKHVKQKASASSDRKKTRLTRVALADALRKARRFETSRVLTTQPTYEYGPHHPPECAALHLLLTELLITHGDWPSAVSLLELQGCDRAEEPQFASVSRSGL
ncbi:MAG: hypothetical protein FWD57_13420 [Polyangiaceae bacterium]|nr:hypothetical protein [Polyangiaceae bacterium]